MPELPEVETMRRHIERSLAGRVLRNLEIRLERVVLWPSDWDPANSREPLSDRLAAEPSGCCSNSTTGLASRCISA